MKKRNKKIHIPHLHYWVEVDFKARKKLNASGLEASTEYFKGEGCRINLRRIPIPKDFPTVAHEVMHVVTMAAIDRGFEMKDEWEHCGYLMQYILNEILGYKFEIVP